MTRKSEKNLAVIQNFILHLTHSDNHDEDEYFNDAQLWTPKLMYEAALDYIKEDHVDGRGTSEEYCIDLWLEAEEFNRNGEMKKADLVKIKFSKEYEELTADEQEYVTDYLDSVGG